jgi:hypothetical protein
MRIAVVLLCAPVMACSPSLSHPTFVPQPTSSLVSVDQRPPPARVELVPLRPSALAVWIDGEWMWRRGRWAWLSGRWVVPPAGAAFSAWVFVRGQDGQLWYAPGEWRDARGMVIDAPTPLSVASVEAGVVVDADGATETTGPILHDRPAKERPEEGAPASAASPGASKGDVGRVNP